MKLIDNFFKDKLYNKFFISEKVASVLLETPEKVINGETSLIVLVNKFSAYKLYKAYNKQLKLDNHISKMMNRFKFYNPGTRKYEQTVEISAGIGWEYLILGDILEKKYKIKFDYSMIEVQVDKGKSLCALIQTAYNRIQDYFDNKNYNTLVNIRDYIKQERINSRIVESQE